MIERLIPTICTILVNVLSNTIYETSKRLLQEHQKKRLCDVIQPWLERFFANHKESVFETDAFSCFVEHQKPFDKIVRYLYGLDNPAEPEETFLRQLVSNCKSSITDAGKMCSILEESAIYELFQGVLHLCQKALREESSPGEVLTQYQQRQSGIEAAVFHQNESAQLGDITLLLQKLTAQQEKITDSVTIENIYRFLSDAIWEGRLAQVREFLPLLAKKNADLESAIKIKLSVLSDDNLSVTNPLEVCSKIENPTLRGDVFRLLILENYEKPSGLAPYVESVSNPVLRSIAAAFAEGRGEQVAALVSTQQDHVPFQICRIAEGLESEQWLVHRLCILEIAKHPAYRSAEAVRELAGQPNFIDQLYIWELSFEDLVQFSSVEEGASAFRALIDEMKAKAGCYDQARLDLKVRFYNLLLRAMDAAKDEQLPVVLDTIPKEISGLPEIEAFRLMEDIKNNAADQDTVLSFALRTGKYQLLARYCMKLHDSQKTLDILHQANFVIGQDLTLFELAVNATCQLQGKSAALTLLKGYEQNYGSLAEFWGNAYILSESDEDRQWVVSAISSRLHMQSMQYRAFPTLKTLAEILLLENKFAETLELLAFIEETGLGDIDVVRMKLHIYTFSERQLDALAEMEKHYEELKDDERIIGAILQISLECKRDIKEKVLARAKECKNAEILLLAAKAEHARQNAGEVEKLVMRAMLITPPEEELLFAEALHLLTESSAQEIAPPKYVKENTCFSAEDLQNHSRLTFCIYPDGILPQTDCQWKDAQHIDVDSAVNQGFMRLSIGDTIDIQGSSYKIVEIGPLIGFFARVCTSSLEQQGLSWSVAVTGLEETLQSIANVFREHPECNRENPLPLYTDFSQPACPIYLLKSGMNLEYGQIMRSLMDTPSIVIRDCVLPAKEEGEREYVLTYTALAALDHLNIDLQKIHDKLIIPSSAAVETQREADAVLQTNGREMVASMAVWDDQVQIMRPTEEMIRGSSQQAVKLKRYAAKLNTAENVQDKVIAELKNGALAQLVGICDYDALILAHTRGAVLVTCEAATAVLAQLEELKVEAMGIADFLCLAGMEIPVLLGTLERMMDCRFRAVITPTVIRYVMKAYDAADNAEKKQIELSWIRVLEKPKSLADENYLKIFQGVCTESLYLLSTEVPAVLHPILSAFHLAHFFNIGGRIEYGFQDGESCYPVGQIDSMCMSENTGLSKSEETDSTT